MENNRINRRTFLETATKSTVAVGLLGSNVLSCESRNTDIQASSLPRWCGFNLLSVTHAFLNITEYHNFLN